MKNSHVSRRHFFKTAAVGVAAPFILKSSLFGADGVAMPSERITMALIGCGGQGTGDMGGFMNFPEVRFVAVCDPVPDHRENARDKVNEKYGNKDCKMYSDFREVLVRDDIDAVLVGTPDHWHAIITTEACKHGKDVYCEKPESLTIREGRAMVDAARRYGRVVSGGSQRVLGDYGDLPKLIRSGAIGEIKEAFVNCGGPPCECHLQPQPVPEGVDWDMWLGPAPWRPFHNDLIHGGFRPYRDYSGGQMTDWGAHRFGAATFAIGVHETGPVEIIPPDGRDVKYLTYRYASGLKIYHGGSENITYKGTEGVLPGKTSTPFTGPSPYVGYKGKGGIFGDFLYSVKSRQKPFRDIEHGHRAASVCHLGNTAYLLNRPLQWDPAKEQFINDPAADRLLDRAKREPWII